MIHASHSRCKYNKIWCRFKSLILESCAGDKFQGRICIASWIKCYSTQKTLKRQLSYMKRPWIPKHCSSTYNWINDFFGLNLDQLIFLQNKFKTSARKHWPCSPRGAELKLMACFKFYKRGNGVSPPLSKKLLDTWYVFSQSSVPFMPLLFAKTSEKFKSWQKFSVKPYLRPSTPGWILVPSVTSIQKISGNEPKTKNIFDWKTILLQI